MSAVAQFMSERKAWSLSTLKRANQPYFPLGRKADHLRGVVDIDELTAAVPHPQVADSLDLHLLIWRKPISELEKLELQHTLVHEILGVYPVVNQVFIA